MAKEEKRTIYINFYREFSFYKKYILYFEIVGIIRFGCFFFLFNFKIYFESMKPTIPVKSKLKLGEEESEVNNSSLI